MPPSVVLLFVELVCPVYFGPVKSTIDELAELCCICFLPAAAQSSYRGSGGFRESSYH